MLKQRLQIGTMKALGLSKTKILLYYILFMNVIGIIGVILGLICGPLILPHVMNIKYNILYELPAMGYSFPRMAAGAMLVGVVVLISLMTYLVIRRELSYVPAKSMRPAAPTLKFKQINKEAKHTSLMMALRNIKVHKAKSIMVILGVMGCTGLSICGFGINDTINKGKDNDMYGVYSADLVIAYSSNQEIGSVKNELLAIDGMDRVDEFTISQTNVIYAGGAGTKTSEMSVYYFEKEARDFKFDDALEGGYWDTTGIGMSEAQANDLGLKEGDEVTFSIGGETQKIKVSNVFYAFACHGIFIYTETMPDLFTTRTNAWADIKDGYVRSEMRDKVNKVKGVNYSKTYEDNMELIESYMSNVRSMTNTILVFAIMLAVVVLINLAILNFEERRRDIATLRVLGFSKFEIAKSLIYEVMFLTAIGAVLGMFLGLPLEIVVLGTNVTPLVSWTYFVDWTSYIYAFIISFFTALLVNILISYRIDKIEMAESLKSIE
jgi:putative ABC transport system permease protein